MSDVLHVEGTKALVAALTKKKPIAALLAELEIDPKRPPEWLVFNYKTSLDIVVHLAAPAFFAEGADEDEFWSEPPRDQIVFAKTGKCQKVTTEGETSDVKAKLADVTAYDVGGFLLQNITWIDAPPKSFADADKLFRTAGDAYQGARFVSPMRLSWATRGRCFTDAAIALTRADRSYG
jgi:hypothetical protein